MVSKGAEMKKGVCLQIGLHRSAEFMLMTQPDWQNNVSHHLKKEPLMNMDSFRFYGVDSDVASINHMLLEYGNPENVEWILANIKSNCSEFTFQTCYRWAVLNSEETHLLPFQSLVCSFDSLLNGLKLDQLDVLIVDIEDNGENIFAGYSWRLKPWYIQYEVHNHHTTTRRDQMPFVFNGDEWLINYLASYGYRGT